ncbi:hypothetical protein DFJ58DRAFT_815895 [Suillus subalutaceus]|uniref:uncharacterized protein n=1 Tax=Suillus subalutaceus TaxID=48586 RepID=UPI001B8833BF|nr:uncharacterized protein DFJ58DRAFT_815895 [Suillus subalutaceus]KAG1837425.1 hypothetical protein DFJ58DRAFT_815895 [Suillus subalutaceus]
MTPLDVDQFSPMPDTSHFLRLPDDVLVYLLDLTPMSDMESVSQTCKQLKAICGLVRAPYLHELNQEGLEYNAASASQMESISQALASLRCRENRWRTMRPITSSCRSTLNESHFTSYSQNIALYVSRQVASTVVHGDTVEHSTYRGQIDEITRFHAADVLQDLLVLLRMHLGTGLSYLCFLSLRGMSLHPAAASPTCVLLTGISSMGYFSAPLHAHGLRILGPWCALLTTDRPSNRLEAQANTLLLCNWKTNALFKLAGIHPDQVDDFNLLNSRTLAVIHRTSNPPQLILRLYDVTFPSHLSSSGCVRLRLSLRLPRIEDQVSISLGRMILPRTLQEQVLQPNQRPQEVFPPNSGIMALSIPLAMGVEKAYLDIAIDVATLLSIARGSDISDHTMLWREWGPKASRIFLIDEALHAEGDVEPLQDVEGYRIAFSNNVDCSDSRNRIPDEHSRPAAFILDFNPASIRWARQEEKAGRGLHGVLVTEPSVLRPGRLLAEEVVSSLPYTRTMLEGYLPQHQIRLSRDEVVYPANPAQGSPLHNVYSFA